MYSNCQSLFSSSLCVFCLSPAIRSGMRAFHTGQTNKSQMMMRARVVAQGVTVAALAFGAYMGVKPHDRPTTMEEVMTRRNQ